MDSTVRFGQTASVYDLYRPDYPLAIVEALEVEGLQVADVGSGTGILTRRLLEAGAHVFALEPNPEMRAIAEAKLGHEARFHSLDGTAEATGLADHCLDLVTAAQAFHWFRPDETRAEFARILKPEGRVALIWNDRRSCTALLTDYEEMLLRYGLDYQEVGHRLISEEQLSLWFDRYKTVVVDNHQSLDWDGLVGRLMSCSYVPRPGHPNYEPMMARLAEVFATYQQDGLVRFEYDTRLFLGRLTPL
ncbi:MAG: class I SAM-dependent methyltransferase [Candidatus Eremiobacteraeota bacterium]|nr:class I SAM-dependent methyltransferase [Candidatus Eremiobacteraeota bacterium]